jgi:hypothetical protein
MLSPQVSVDLSQFRALRGQTLALLGHACEDVADGGADDAVENAKSQGRFKDRTGNLRRSIAVTKRARFDGRRAIAEAAARTTYAAHVEWGTRPHVIRARRVPNLVFYWPKIGRMFVGPKVNHPGTSGRFYMSMGARHAYYSMIRRWPSAAARIGRLWR